MARHPRLIVPQVALHLIQRGNNRNACFAGDTDYLTYLSQLRFLCRKYECELHAYCLMTNHVHLLLTPHESNGCSMMMRDLGRTYVRYFNRRHGRSGTLWEGRFRACAVESARYVLACYRYIEANPVRAGMVNAPELYPWSSHTVNTGIRIDPALRPHAELTALAPEAAARHAAYRALFEQSLEEALLKSIREATHGGFPLASEAFKTLRLPGQRTARGRPGPRPLSE